MTTVVPFQNYDNHRKFVPGYHYVAMMTLLINVIYAGYVAVTSFTLGSVMGLFLAVGLVMLGFYARFFALSAQDRVIRLEERLRLRDLLPRADGRDGCSRRRRRWPQRRHRPRRRLPRLRHRRSTWSPLSTRLIWHHLA